MLWMIRSCTPELSQEPARGGVGRSPSWSAEGEGEGWGTPGLRGFLSAGWVLSTPALKV